MVAFFSQKNKAKNNKTKHISRISRIFISHKTIVVTVVQRRTKFKENIEIDREIFLISVLLKVKKV